MYRYHCLIIILVLFAANATAQAARHTKDATKTIKEKMEKKTAVMIDVREKREWDTGHLEKSTLVPLSKLKTEAGLKEMLKKLPKDKKTIVYCHWKSGGRVLQVADILKKQGYDVRPLKKGFDDLVKDGFKKAKDKKKPATTGKAASK